MRSVRSRSPCRQNQNCRKACMDQSGRVVLHTIYPHHFNSPFRKPSKSVFHSFRNRSDRDLGDMESSAAVGPVSPALQSSGATAVPSTESLSVSSALPSLPLRCNSALQTESAAGDDRCARLTCPRNSGGRGAEWGDDSRGRVEPATVAEVRQVLFWPQ